MLSESSLDKFCGSKFWDSSLSWNTSDPDLTICFEKTILLWIPSVFLWIFSFLEVFYILNSKSRDVHWNWLNISKLSITIFLCFQSITELIVKAYSKEKLYSVDIFSPVITLSSYVLSASILLLNRKYGLHTSGVQFLFWLLGVLCGAFQLRSEMKAALTRTEYLVSHSEFYMYLIHYVAVVTLFLLNCFADKTTENPVNYNLQKVCPEKKSGFLSKMFFSWFDSFAWMGYKKPLVKDDLWDLKYENCATNIIQKFNKYYKSSPAKESYRYTPANQSNEVSYRSNSGNVLFSGRRRKQISLLPALVKSFGATFLFSAFLNFVDIALSFVGPQILKLLINFAKNKEEKWKGYVYAVILFVTAIIQIIMHTQHFTRMNDIRMGIDTALVSTIYRKALKMSNSARKESTVGEIVNLMAVDAQKISGLTGFLHLVWSVPLRIVLSLYFLWNILGPSVLAGLAVMIIMSPINGFIANKLKKYQIKQMRNKDERAKLMNEIFNGIKVLKLYAWEPSFQQQVLKIRNKEISVMKKAAYVSTVSSFLFSCAPFMVILMSFATYVMVDEKNILDASTAFVSISLFNILKHPMTIFPTVISILMQGYVSIQRVNKFLNLDDLEPDSVTHDTNEGACLVIEDGTFSWGGGNTLNNINVHLSRYTLTAVVGSIGSGKSSLISAFLGEIDKRSGRVNTVGSVAYVAQQAWIQNATLRDNILFGKRFNKGRYDKVIEACALESDLDMLPAGDSTEIGENGINLSGGQKQRVSLARAVYADADIYFLDDPLSAVDSHVGRHIFEQVIGSNGILRSKTRVLVTHAISYLPLVDTILVMKDGEISEIGTYQQLVDRKGAFAEFLANYLNSAVSKDSQNGTELIHDILDVNPDVTKTLRRYQSRIAESESCHRSKDELVGLETSTTFDVQKKHGSNCNGAPDPTPKSPNKLIQEEKLETGSVSFKIYRYYLKSIGLFLVLLNIIFIMTVQAFDVASSFWLAKWTSDPDLLRPDNTTNIEKRNIYLGVYGLLGIGQGIVSMITDYGVFFGGLTAANIIHEKLLHNMLRVPLSFYDTTPTGRMLSRFTKDIEILDSTLQWNLSELVTCCMKVMGTLFVISYSSPPFIVVILICGLLYYAIQRIYVETSRQLKRLESVSRSPIYSHFGESLTGVSTIRAYNQQKRFITEADTKLDQNQSCKYPSFIASCWLSVRMKMIGNLIILFSALFAVLGRDNLDAGLIGLSVSYALRITQMLNSLVRLTSQIETNIVAVERVREYTDSPQEAPWKIPNKNPSPLWPEIGIVSFDNFSVKYRPELDLVLQKCYLHHKG
ncbi:hypothetical protein WA026_014848 [Henosepilachna vigintioctopunctata]|uniref:ABC-type glutathione-S-conjugate transporter n=1 Tax=Henosepilachna vigintioctopunctata TaxID=420089 RepID=A0AAW1V2G4_9CUCU